MCRAYGINSSGRITGESEITPGGARHAFLTDTNGGNMKDLGTLPFGNFSAGNAVNDNGQVVGRANAADAHPHAFISAPNGGSLTDIGIFPGTPDGNQISEALAINNYAEVVGVSGTLQTYHAFIYTTARGLEDLNDLIDPSSDFILLEARGINDHGQISGYGVYVNGPAHAFVLTPGIPDQTNLGLTLTGGTTSAGSGGSFSFTSLGNIKVTQLAVLDSASDGLSGPMNVSLAGPNNQVLANLTIPAGTSARLVNGFRYVPLPVPLLIPAGPDVYTISSTGSEPVVANGGSITPGPEIASAGGTLGPNFVYTTSPLSDADFETGPFMTVGAITGWTVTGNVGAVNQGATSGSHGAALSIGADSEGDSLSQTFFTRPNLRYSVDFDSGVFGQRSDDPLQLETRVMGNTTLLNQTVTPPEVGTSDPALVAFQHYRFDFVADAATSMLKFTDIGLGNVMADVVLDKVILVPAPPSYVAWQATYFTDSQQNDLTVSGPAADPDRDGLPNGFEFYFNFNPVTGMTAAERTLLPQLSVPTNSSMASLAYRRRIGSGGVIGFSKNLQVWDERDIIQPTGATIPSGDNITQTFTATIATVSPAFFRLTLSQTHPRSAAQWKSSAGGNNHWYEIVKTPVLTWRQARDYAIDHGGYLATITGSNENNFVKSLFDSGIAPFIGGYKENNLWRWVTGEPFNFTNWDAGEPNNFGGVEDRLQFLGASGKWNDTSKSFTNAFIVEYPN
jgi:probable HAF family extracellular repeat protein